MSSNPGRIFNPYPGLRPFREEEAHLFFGRNAQVDELLAALRQSRFLAVMGASGSGKSSLVAAGLYPALHGGLAPGLGSSWAIASMRPGANPIRNLATALSALPVIGDVEEEPLLALARVEATLRASALGLSDLAATLPRDFGGQLLVVVDQFEELFRYDEAGIGRPSDGAAFVQLLLEASRSDAPVDVITTMRSDFLGDCARFRDLPETINNGLYLVPRLTRSQLREAIAAPAAVGGARLAPRLVQRVLNDAGSDPDALPLVQHALMRTWDLWEERGILDVPLDLDVYEEAGGAEEALSRHADEAYHELDESRRVAEIMFKRLTEIGRDGRETRRPTPLDQVVAVAGSTRPEVEEVVEVFGRPGRSFVTVSEDEVVDISHESLIRQWARLRTWAHEEARSRDEYLRLADAAGRWESGEAALLPNPDLQVASLWWEETRPNQAWADRYDPTFDMTAEYLDQSREAARRRRIMSLAGIVGVAVVAVVFAVLALWALRSEAAAELEKATAVARYLAGAAVESGAAERELGILTALEALSATEDHGFRLPEAEEALRTLVADPLGMTLPATPGQSRHGDTVEAVAFSDDGRWLATGAADNTVIIWDARDPAADPIVLTEHEAGITAASFSSDGRWLATGDEAGVVLVRDVATPQAESHRFTDHASPVSALEFSPDGSRLATAADDPVLLVHPVGGTPDESMELVHDGRVLDLEFSPDGRQLVTGSGDGIARVWELSGATPSERRILEGVPDVVAVAFEPMTGGMVIGTRDGMIQILSARGEQGPELEHPEGMEALAVSRDGRWLATTGGDNTMRLWSLENPEIQEAVLIAPVDGVVDEIAFDPDNRWLVVGGVDQPARLHDLDDPGANPLSLAGPVLALDFGSDGAFAIGSSHGSVRLWDADELTTRPGRLVHRTSDGSMSDVLSLAFNPDGSTLTTGTDENALWSWPLAGSNPAPSMDEIDRAEGFDEAGLDAVAYAPDGRFLVTGSGDETVWIRDLDSPGSTPVRVSPGGGVRALAISPDSRWLAVALDDHAPVLVDMSTAELTQIPLEYHQDDASDVAFGPDGSLAVASRDREVTIWDAEDPAEPAEVLEGHGDVVTSVDFSADGRWLATGSWDGTVLLRDVNNVSEVAFALDQLGRVDDVALRPDGALLAAAVNGRVMLWDLTTEDPTDLSANPVELPAGNGSDLRVGFSPDGFWLATTAGGGDALVWMQLEDLKTLACQSVGRNLTTDEWEALHPGETYQRTCEEWPDG